MSIVSVHGPHTFGSKAVAEAGAVMAVVDPTNGLKWDFKLDSATTRPDQDFSWAFPTDGTPTPQAVADPSVVTYATPGAKTATLTVTNGPVRTVSNKALTNNVATLTTTAPHGFKVGQSVVVSGVGAPFDGTYVLTAAAGSTFSYAKVNANVTSAASGGSVSSDPAQYPPAGSYPLAVTAVSGVAPRMAGPEQQSIAPPADAPVEEVEPYDPADHTVAQVLEYADANPDQVQALYEDELEGKERTTLLDGLVERGAQEP